MKAVMQMHDPDHRPAAEDYAATGALLLSEPPPRTMADATPVHILLLEDSDIDAELLTLALERSGPRFGLTRVSGRRGFLAALGRGGFDLILADYSLPDFDGLSALHVARERQPGVPFIFVSGVVGEDFATDARRQGAVDYVLKRNLARLSGAVERAIAETREREQRRRAEHALHATETNIRLAAEAANLGLWEYHPLSGRLHWDERALALLGLPADTPARLIGLITAAHPDDREHLAHAIDRALTPGGSGNITESFRAAERWLVARGQAFFEDGVCTRCVGILQDVTDERRKDEALRRSNQALEARVEERTRERDGMWRLSDDLMCLCTPEAALLAVNPAWARQLGWQEEELVGGSLAQLLHPADVAPVTTRLARMASGSAVRRFDGRLRNRDGSCRLYRWAASTEHGAIYAVGRDITEEMAAIDELAAANRQLRTQIEERERVEATLRQMQRLDAVGQLTSGVAHDFNNLLTIVLGNLSALGRAALPDDQQRRIEMMRQAAERGARLTGQLLAFSRRQRLEPRSTDLNDLVASLRDLLQSTMGGSVRIGIELHPGLWPALVDPTQLELAILNLAINARDAMDVGGELRVSTDNLVLRASEGARRPEEPGPGQYVVLSVSDNGSGMTPEVLAKAFEPFFTTKEIGKGSGLGLAQVFGFAKQSGGGVRIESEVGRGTTVSVFLPRTLGSADGQDDAADAEVPRPAGPAPLVLLVDDDSAVREITALTLAELGYEVVEAGSGGAALELLDRRPDIDLMLVDFAMPGMNGAEVVREAAQRRPGLPTLFITGYATPGALAGVDEDRIVPKPFREEDLAEKLARALRGGGSPRRADDDRREGHGGDTTAASPAAGGHTDRGGGMPAAGIGHGVAGHSFAGHGGYAGQAGTAVAGATAGGAAEPGDGSSAPPSTEAGAAPGPVPATAGSLDILYVEDNDVIRMTVTEYIDALGHRITAMASAEEALEVLEPGRFDLLFTDISLPGMSGVDLAREAARRSPGLAVVLASGYDWQMDLKQFGLDVITLPKPFDLERLDGLLEEIGRARR